MLAERVGVATSTVRYYERIGLLAGPARTVSGYREYDDADATHLLLVVRARRIGLSCDEVASLLRTWDADHCAEAGEQVGLLIDAKQAEISARIEELRLLGEQLEAAREELRAAPHREACCADLTCCVPTATTPVVVDVVPRPRSAGR